MVQSPFQLVLERLLAEFSTQCDGEPASYIPELARADPSHFGIAIATVDGVTYCAGDARIPFTIQSISKPLVYGLALDDNGAEFVDTKVGVEPSGEAFNAISLEPGSGRPRNPMINAGAIAMSSLVAGETSDAKFDRVREMLSRYAGRPLDVDESVFRSERETGHRNRAIGHLLRNAGIVDGEVDPVCDRYFRQCAVSVTCEDLALMAATLANKGCNPRTGDQAVAPENVERILSVMSTCGMYDFAGAWVYRVGMPAKSGVGGGIIAVLPGQLGIGVFSPLLDALGNSVRGVAVCQALSREFGLHLHRPPLSVGSVVRASYTLSDRRSKRSRTREEAEALDAAGGAVRVLEAQGPIVLSTAEALIRTAIDQAPPTGALIIDMRRVTGIDRAIAPLFSSLSLELARHGTTLALSGIKEEADLPRPLRGAFHADDGGERYATLDAALEACEERLLGSAAPSRNCLAPADHSLVAMLRPADRACLMELAEAKCFAPGAAIMRRGDPSDALYLLLSGRVTVSIPSPSGTPHRLATLGPGTIFGELALMDSGPRSADVHADTTATCLAIPLEPLRADPVFEPLRLRLVEALAHELADRLRRANAEIEALAG